LAYWLGPDAPGWPDVELYVDPVWDADEREVVLTYLRAGFVARAYLGASRCRICAEWVGSLELTDGTFLWPQGFEHYVKEHPVRPPADFVTHVGERRTQNQPGTFREYPNWQVPLCDGNGVPVLLDELFEHPRVQRLVAAICAVRG
jgi:hypothetical protein